MLRPWSPLVRMAVITWARMVRDYCSITTWDLMASYNSSLNLICNVQWRPSLFGALSGGRPSTQARSSTACFCEDDLHLWGIAHQYRVMHVAVGSRKVVETSNDNLDLVVLLKHSLELQVKTRSLALLVIFGTGDVSCVISLLKELFRFVWRCS